MDTQHIRRLLLRYHNDEATESERRELEQMLESGIISLEDIDGLRGLEDRIAAIETAVPSSRLDESFYRMLAREKRPAKGRGWKFFFTWPEMAPGLALASITLILGLLVGYSLRPPAGSAGDEQIATLSRQVSDLQEMMMLSLLEKGSATERLKAVNLTHQMNEASRKVTNALLQTLNQDENINVRLAALEALKPYAADGHVREALIRSIGRQESPLVQVSLAELMVALHERSSIGEFQKILESDKTPREVKEKIKESIDVLI